MKSRILPLAIAVLVIVVVGIYLLRKAEKPAPIPQQPVMTKVATPTPPVSPLQPTNQTPRPLPPAAPQPANPSTIPSEIAGKYHQGLISKGEAMQDILEEQNKKPLDIYGKVVDQYGQPIVGANVTGGVLLNVDPVHSGGETHSTVTDAQGDFNFLGLHGVKLGIRVQKDGYIFDAKRPFIRPSDYQPDPYNPLKVTMWKIRGAEHLVSVNFASAIGYDGTPTIFDIATQKASPSGDLRVTLSRSPLDVQRGGQKFDWALKIEMLEGGLQPENDPYPYWAPDAGYNPAFDFNMNSNNVPWRSQFTQDFYIKSAQGQYGRMQATVYTSMTPARIEFNFTMNPSGSQNLEPSP